MVENNKKPTVSTPPTVVAPPPLPIPSVPSQQQTVLRAPTTNGIKGADQHVISKLRNNLEMKEIEKQKQLMSSSQAPDMPQPPPPSNDEDSHRDMLGAHLNKTKFRTKGEVKSFQPLPSVEAPPAPSIPLSMPPPPSNVNELEKAYEIKMVPLAKAEALTEPLATVVTTDMDSSSAFDLMDWGSACNDFVEQLQGGGTSAVAGVVKKRGRRRLRTVSATNSLIEPAASQTVFIDCATNNPSVVNVPTELINSAVKPDTTAVVAVKSLLIAVPSSSEDDTPLLLLRQQSLKESGADLKVESTSTKTDQLEEKPAAARNKKEQQREKREHEKKLTIATSSDSADDLVADRIKQRSKKIIRKPRTRAAGVRNSSSGDDSSENEQEERARKQKELLKLNNTAGTSGNNKIVKNITAPVRSLSSSASSDEDDDSKTPIPLGRRRIPKLESDAKSASSSDETAAAAPPPPPPPATKRSESDDDCETSADSDEEDAPSSGTKKSNRSRTEETMTRSKRKRVLEEEVKANSKVLRNEKVIKNVPIAVANDSVVGAGKKVPTDKVALKSKQRHDEDGADSSKSPPSKRRGSTRIKSQIPSSDSDEGEIKPARLRTRSSKSIAESAEKTPEKSVALAKVNKSNKSAKKNIKEVTPSPNKNSVDNHTELVAEKKPPVLNGLELQHQLYEYKRSLKIPARLISIGRPPWHRKSTSLPDLDPQHSSDASETTAEQKKRLADAVAAAAAVVDTPPKKETKRGRPSNATKAAAAAIQLLSLTTPPTQIAAPAAAVITAVLPPPGIFSEDHELKSKSIIDLLHQRVLVRPTVAAKHQQKKLRTCHSESKILPQSNETELLDTPGVDGANAFKHQNVFETAVLPSRTRKELRVQKKQEIIRGVFGCDDDHRPASAPPLNCDDTSAVTAGAAIKTEDGADEFQPIQSTMTYDQKYKQYLEKMNVDFGEKNRKGPPSTVTSTSTAAAAGTTSDLLLCIKQEKMDTDDGSNMLMMMNDDETQDTEIAECTAGIKEELLTEREDTQSVASERDGQTPNSFKSMFPAKKNRGNRAGRRKGSSG